MTAQELKVAAARAALTEVRDGMRLGLGTGSTADEFVRLLGASPHRDSVRCTCTSLKTEALARSHGLRVEPLADVAPLDLAVDGADEIDSALRLIKGRGAALLREKIVEQQARRFIVIADDSKVVARLGTGPLPVEVTPFALAVLLQRFAEMALRPSLRMSGDTPLATDEGNRIIDILVPEETDIANVVSQVRSRAGVIDTGFFPSEATEALIASEQGIRHMTR